MTLKCEICEVEFTKHRCPLCGRLVCDVHFNPKKRMCRICEMALCELCSKALAVSYCPICGRLGCSDCLVQLTPVVRVCKDCIAKHGVNKVKEMLKIK